MYKRYDEGEKLWRRLWHRGEQVDDEGRYRKKMMSPDLDNREEEAGWRHPRILVLVMSNVQKVWRRNMTKEKGYDVGGVGRWRRKKGKGNDKSRSWQSRPYSVGGSLWDVQQLLWLSYLTVYQKQWVKSNSTGINEPCWYTKYPCSSPSGVNSAALRYFLGTL